MPAVEEVFEDYAGRRIGIIRALTADVDLFYALCHPERENLCLYGYPDGSWDVRVPPKTVRQDLPQPTVGINFARVMNRWDWLSLIAVHSDCWLLSVAFFSAAGFSSHDRERLFTLINRLPTVFEVFCDRGMPKEDTDVGSRSESKQSTKRLQRGRSTASSSVSEDNDENSEI